MIIEKLLFLPLHIQPVMVEAVLMPNGELISKGKTIGFYRDYEDVIYYNKYAGSKTKGKVKD